MMSLHEPVELLLSSLEGGNSRALFDYTLPLVALHQCDLLQSCKKTQSSNHNRQSIMGSFEIIGDSINIQ
jgi:hypothetical protein